MNDRTVAECSASCPKCKASVEGCDSPTAGISHFYCEACDFAWEGQTGRSVGSKLAVPVLAGATPPAARADQGREVRQREWDLHYGWGKITADRSRARRIKLGMESTELDVQSLLKSVIEAWGPLGQRIPPKNVTAFARGFSPAAVRHRIHLGWDHFAREARRALDSRLNQDYHFVRGRFVIGGEYDETPERLVSYVRDWLLRNRSTGLLNKVKVGEFTYRLKAIFENDYDYGTKLEYEYDDSQPAGEWYNLSLASRREGGPPPPPRKFYVKLNVEWASDLGRGTIVLKDVVPASERPHLPL